MRSQTLLAAVLASASAVAAQGPPPYSEGPFVALPHAMSVASGTSGPGGALDETLLYMKADGFNGSAPGTWAVAVGLPDWRMSSILQNVSPRPDVDAFSIGFDWVVSNGDGVAVVPPGGWAGITLSVTRATAGRAGEAIAVEAARADGAAADVFSYILPGSALPPDLVDRTLRAQDSTEINVSSPGTPGDLDAHDMFVAFVYGQNPQLLSLIPPVLTTPQRAFFSVTDATKGRVPAGWWGGTTPSGATILCSTWDATAGRWTTPVPFISHADLGLAATEELDAVAIDIVHNEMLFSTETPTRDPLLWATGFGTHLLGIVVKKYRAPDGVPIATKIGLLTGDDLDSICALDPSRSPLLQLALGTPVPPPLVGPPPQFSASLFRGLAGPQQEFFRSHVAGWPPRTGPGPGFAGGFIGLLAPAGWIPLTVWPSNTRNPNNPFQGDPHYLQIPIPQHVALRGYPVFVWWLMADQNLQDIAWTHPLSVKT